MFNRKKYVINNNIYKRDKLLTRGSTYKIYIVKFNNTKYIMKRMNKYNENEITIHSKLLHSNIVKLLDYSYIHKQTLILEYCSQTLEDACLRYKFSVKNIYLIF